MKGKLNRILIITPSLSSGGAEKIACNLANLFDKKGYEVEIICIYKNKNYYYLSPNILITNLNSKRISGSIFKLRQILLKKKKSIIISFLSVTNICLTFSSLFTKKKHLYIYTQHEIPSKTFNKFFSIKQSILISVLIRITYLYADKIICVSEGLKYELKKLFFNQLNHKIIKINNYIPYKKRESYFIKKLKNPIRILSIGRIIASKDFNTLIKAIDLIREKYEFKLTIVGEGPLSQQIIKEINKYNLQKICQIKPFTNNIQKHYLNSDIYVSTSLHESFGNTIVEAMHFDLFIISTNCPYGPKEILENGKFGSLINMKSYKELAKSIEHIIHSQNLPDYKMAIKKYDEKVIFSRYLELFKELS